jgi:acetyl esterase/lipase
MAAYTWLLSQQDVSPERVFLMGDSAGGTLVLDVLNRLKMSSPGVLAKIPGGILISPWVDLGDFQSESWDANANTDFLNSKLGRYFASLYFQNSSETLRTTSPSEWDLTGYPPLYIEVGAKECLYDQIRAFYLKASCHSVDVTLYEARDMVHVFPIFVGMGMEEVTNFFHRVNQFVRSRYSLGSASQLAIRDSSFEAENRV